MNNTDFIDEERLADFQDQLMKKYLVNGTVFDISAFKASGDPLTPAKFADLSAALGTNGANIPQKIRRGGMSVKFVQSSDNKYVQFRYMSSSTAAADFTNVNNWQGVDDEPTAGSDNLIKSGGVYKFVEETGIIEQRIIGISDSYTSYPCLLSAGKCVLGLTNKNPDILTGVYFFNSNGEQINNDSPLTVTENCYASVIYDLPEDCASVRIAGIGNELVILTNGLAQEINEINGYERYKIIGRVDYYTSYNCVLPAGKYVLELTNKLSAEQTGVYFFNSNNEQINYDSSITANPNNTVLGVYNLPEPCATVRIAGIGTELVISEYGLKGVERDVEDLKPKVYNIGKSDDNITIIRKNDVKDNNLLLLSDGTTGSYDGYYTSDYIPVTSNTYFCGNGIFVVSDNLKGYAVYDSEKTFIAAGGSENAEPYHVLPFNIKSRYSNAAFIRFSLADVDNRASFAIISEHGSGELLNMERLIVEYASEISPIEKSIKPVIKTVKENGTVGTDCDFTDIKSALDSISDNSYNKQYVILVKNGTYDITGTDYLGLKNYVTIKGENRDRVVVRNSSPSYSWTNVCFDPAKYGDNIIEYASIENITMRVNNGKCCVHIDGYSIVDGGKILIKNCCLINEVENENGGINCGLRGGQTVEIDNCYGNCLAYAHTRNNPGSAANPNNFIIRNSCLTSIGFYDISDKVSDYKKNKLIVENCKCDYIGIGVSELASDKTKCSIEYIIDKNTIFNWVYIMGQNFIAGFDDWFSKYPICSSIHRFVSNNSGNTITKGTFVSISIQGGVPALDNTIPMYGYNIAPYDGEHLYGIALEDIADGDSGIVQCSGKIFISNNNYTVGQYIALNKQGQPIVGTKENAIGVVTNPDQPFIGQTLMLLTNTERTY